MKSVILVLAIMLVAIVANAQGVTGNYCVQDYEAGANCTANDVRIEAMIPLSVVEYCDAGTIGYAIVNFQALISASGSPNRYDIGIFVALDGGSALTGDLCYHGFLEPPLTATPTYGDSNSDTVNDILNGPWWDADADSCGDIESNTQVISDLVSLQIACVDTNADGYVDISVATSWFQNTGSACADVSGAVPGGPSKCSALVDPPGSGGDERINISILPVPVDLQTFTVD